jgi:hypothetical protein
LIISFLNTYAQETQPATAGKTQINRIGAPIDSAKQRDLIDIVSKVFHISSSTDERKVAKKASFSIVPSVSYSLTTGYQADLSSNVGFYTTASHAENYSAITSDLTIDTKHQKLAFFRSEIWSKDNAYKFVSDTRWERFPETTYGLGTETTDADADPIDYKYVRNYLTIYKKLFGAVYGGAGYNLDYHYGIKESGLADSAESGFKKYGLKPTSISSGINLSLLFDNRQNALNPINGGYASIIYRQNQTFLGSNNNWQSLQFDLRRYFRTSPDNNNILAFWSLLWFTNGNVPYLDLPGTGKDMFKNSGRGYIEGRFLGKNMLYLESEYRFGITENGFLGGVVFANAESVSEFQSNQFKKVAPAAGTGLRFKINKHSNTNACLDYAVGINHSNGFFLNLGEVF